MVNAFSLILLLLLFPFKAMLQHFNFLLFYLEYLFYLVFFYYFCTQKT